MTTLQNTADLLRGIIDPRAILPRNPWHARRKRRSSPKAALKKRMGCCAHITPLEAIHKGRPHREGEGGSPKADIVREVASIYSYSSSQNSDKGGGGQKKPENFANILYVWPLRAMLPQWTLHGMPRRSSAHFWRSPPF